MAEEADSSGTTGSSGANWWSPTPSCSSVSATMVSGIRMHANNNNNTSPLNYCSSSTNVNEEVGSPSLTTTNNNNNNNNNNSTITMESSGLTHQELGVDSFLDHSSHIPPFANGETTNNIWTQMLLGGCNEEELQSTSNNINMNMIYPPQMKKMNNNKWAEAHEHNMRLPSMLHNPMMQFPIQGSNGMSFSEMVPQQYLNQNQQASFCRSPLFDLGKVKQEKSLLSSHSELQQVQSLGMNHSNITGGNKQWPSHHHQLNLPQQNNNKVIDFSSSKTHSDQPKRQQLHSTNNNIKCLGKQPNKNNTMSNEDQQRPDASINTKPDHSAADMPLFKRPRIESTSTVTTFKKSCILQVRKEKLGDRITALQQLVNPFGKTDTASVLLEAIGYIKFLQEQVQVLSTPYLKSGETLIQTKPNQMSWDKDSEEPALDLRSRGLCLVPVSCTLHVANDNGADYWSGNYR